jgi:N-acetylglutamate synthase-like GNAT family acetyltransferase
VTDRVRAATAGDVPALRAVGVAAWEAASAGILPPAEVANGIAEFFNEYSLSAAVRSGRMLVAERDGTVVGLLEHDRPAPGRAVIWKVCVEPAAQGCGVGRALVERYLATADAPRVEVEHDPRAAAAGAFFERLGFVPFETGTGTVRRVRRARPR